MKKRLNAITIANMYGFCQALELAYTEEGQADYWRTKAMDHLLKVADALDLEVKPRDAESTEVLR